MRYIVSADTGGTFTDLAAFDRETNRLVCTKSLTTYDDLVNGLMNCVHKAKIDLSHTEIVKFATTLVINTFLQRNGAKTALLTTEGHRDILEIRRGNRPIPFDLRYVRDPVLVERDLRFEVRERIAGDGTITKSLDREQLAQLAGILSQRGVEAIGISFLNSYANSKHEQEAAALLRSLLPTVYVITGTELTREWYEYERTSTAVANAYVGPTVKDYIVRMDDRLRSEGFSETLYLMASNGGVVSLDRAQQQPGTLLESGPVGGCIGAAAYATELGLDNVIAFDMGGTTAKCAVIQNGQFDVKSPYYVGGEERGFPVRHAILDIAEVGAGGGSIAWLDTQKRLSVGPRSAGSDPGPAAYGRGGTEPTITDANVTLGRISAQSFLGGEMELDARASDHAISEKLAKPLGFKGASSLDEMAQGIISLGTLTMASAIRQITTERGLDPRDFALFAFGGGGPLHAQALAKEMNILQVIIPPEPGLFSAIGMLLADARVDETRTFLHLLSNDVLEELIQAFTEMEAEIEIALRAQLKSAEISFIRQVQMRFVGQRHYVSASAGPDCSIDTIRRNFESVYRKRYGFVETGAPIEIVGVTITGIARVHRPLLGRLAPGVCKEPVVTSNLRSVYFAESGTRLDTPVYQRSSLPSGFSSSGPAVIEEYGSTTIVGPGDSFQVGKLGEIRIHVNQLDSQSEYLGAARDCTQDASALNLITAEMIRHALLSIPNQIDVNITRTAYSPIVYVYKDFAAGIVDPEGRLICQGKGSIPIFVANALGVAVRDGIALHGRNGIVPGDVIFSNHAATLGQHLNNVVMYTPVYAGPEDSQLVGFMAVLVHWIDIGGMVVGSGATSQTTDIFQEGIQFRSVKLWSAGKPVTDIFRIIENNTRFPRMLLGDVQAQLAGCLLGKEMVGAVIRKYGLVRVNEAIELMWNRSEASVRLAVAKIPDGTYTASSFLDGDSIDVDRRVDIKVIVRVHGDEITVDLSGVSDQVKGPINSGREGGAVAAARIAFKYLLASDEPANDGTFRPLHVLIPDGKFLSATGTAPMGGYSSPLPTVIDTILKAMVDADPRHVAAGHHANFGIHGFSGRRPDTNEFYFCNATMHGGWGASFGHDGPGPYKTMAHGDTLDVPVEMQEALYPVRIEVQRLRTDSGGAGQFRGGLGVEKICTYLAPCSSMVSSDRLGCPPWGILGGRDGAPAEIFVNRPGKPTEAIQKGVIVLNPGDQVRVLSGAGGGYGDPLKRDVSRVERDVQLGFVSQESALSVYGVVLDSSGMLLMSETLDERERLSKNVVK